jgi:hypothetical protein
VTSFLTFSSLQSCFAEEFVGAANPDCGVAYARAVFAAGLLATLAALASVPTLGPAGIGTVRFGTAKSEAVAELRALLGAPSGRGVNTGCGPRYTEVAWGDLVAEFRAGTFSGFRYVVGGWPLTTPGSPRRASPPVAKLATSRGISLGDTLARVRGAYGVLRLVGTDRWRSPSGLVFVDEPRSRHIVEIKTGTCGDF